MSYPMNFCKFSLGKLNKLEQINCKDRIERERERNMMGKQESDQNKNYVVGDGSL